MEQKIQLKHPAGKAAVRIDTAKYEVIEKAMLHVLKQQGALTHPELFDAVKEYFNKNNLPFQGSLDWYTQSVKMNLEATQIIERTTEKPQKYKLKTKRS